MSGPSPPGAPFDGAFDGVLDRALDELYTVAPDEFVATRARLVAELRGEGETEAAKELGSARRPTVAAWALNQVAHRERSLIDELLRLSGALRDAQQRAVAGDAGDLRDATRAEREVLERVLGSAIAIAGSGAATNVATQIGGTLQAASTSADAGEMLRQGRLVKELQPSSGFPGGDSAVDAPARAPRRAPAGAPEGAVGRPGGGAGNGGRRRPRTGARATGGARARRAGPRDGAGRARRSARNGRRGRR